MRITFVCGREGDYPRNQLIRQALNRIGVVRAVYPESGRLSFNLVRLSFRLFLLNPQHQHLYFVGFYGQPLVLAARLRWRGPLVFDAFLSTYDTYCFDRKIFPPHSWMGRLAFWLDKLSCKLADIVVLDTQSHARYFCNTFDVPENKLRVLYVGCDETFFKPQEWLEPDPPIVLFYGSFLPLHGVEVIVQAAHLMRDDRVRFRIVGSGQLEPKVRRLVQRLSVDNVEFLPPMPYRLLPGLIASCTICLGGHFGSTEKASRVISSKAFQCMASGKPTILGDNPANRELFVHGRDAWMVRMNDPQALANGIREVLSLSAKERMHLGASARETVIQAAGSVVYQQVVNQIVLDALRCKTF